MIARFLARAGVVISFGAVLACDDCSEGDEGCPCYDNETCNGSLACRSKTCVILDPNEPGPGAGGVDLAACTSCAEDMCSMEVSACRDTQGCEGFVDCIIECGADASCQTGCTEGVSAEAQANSVLLTACAYVACPSECVGTPAMSPGGTTPDPVTPVPPTPGDPGPSPNPGGTPTTPSPNQPAEPVLVEGTNWLAVEGETAPGSETPNSELGIEGVFYAYGDGCAEYTWDAVGRCISGTHCAPSAANWGVGIGFDFYNDGTQKTVWSATEHAARGIAWSATSNDFQVWLTNMDPSFGSSCGPMVDCTIQGPPDGYGFASFDGTLYFNNLSKDDWGGTGVVYAFDPTRLLSIQFKIPSSTVNPEFNLCIRALGIIL